MREPLDETLYDEMIDRLALWSVRSLTSPGEAVQAYWLDLMLQCLAEWPGARLTLTQVLQWSRADVRLPEWAEPYARPSLDQLLRAEDWLEVVSERSCQPGAGGNSSGGQTTEAEMTIRLTTGYRPYLAELQDETGRLWQATCWLYGERPTDWQLIPLEVLRGAVLFEAGLFFACHEYFETLWGRTGDPASDFYQGLIQVAVAMRHLESHNRRGAQLLLSSGLTRLQGYPDTYKGLPVHRFIAQLQSLQQSLEGEVEVSSWGKRPGLLVRASRHKLPTRVLVRQCDLMSTWDD